MMWVIVCVLLVLASAAYLAYEIGRAPFSIEDYWDDQEEKKDDN